MNRRTFLTTALLAPFASRLAAQDASPTRLRVLSYNIRHGEGMDGKIDLPRIAKVIRATQADIVSLQEVDRNTRRSKQVDQPAELGRLTGLTPVFERNIPYQGGDYGNAVLSRFKVKRHQNHKLPSMYQGEQRGVLEVEVETPGGPLLFLATHLDYRRDDKERRASIQTIEDLFKARREAPALLVGDLNAEPDSEVLKSFAANWHIAAGKEKALTFPSRQPTKQIDYVLCRPAGRWKVHEFRVIDEPVASDHRPVLAVLELTAPAGGK